MRRHFRNQVRRVVIRSEIYSGMIGRASVNFFVWHVNQAWGIACGLNHLQKLRDGTPMIHRSTPEEDFAEPWEEE